MFLGREAVHDSVGATRVARTLAWLGLESASCGLATWAVRSWSALEAYITANTLSPDLRRNLVTSLGTCVGVVWLIAIALLVAGRQQSFNKLSRLAERLAPLCVIGYLPFLLHRTAWHSLDLSFLILVSIFGLALQGLLRISLNASPVWPQRQSLGLASLFRARYAWLPLCVVLVGSISYAIYFAYFTVQNHYGLRTSAYDLGLEDNLVWNAVHGGPLFRSTPLGGNFNHGGFHQTYFAYVIGLFYLLYPHAETLLVVQAVLIGACAIPLFLLARRRLGPWVAALLSCLFLLYPPLHGSNLYDFHYQPLGVFFLLFSLYFLETRRDRLAALSILVALSVREDMSALLAIFGVYLTLKGERPRAGLIVAAIGTTVFVMLKMVIMPNIMDGHQAFIHQYKALVPQGEQGFGAVVKTVIGNPGFTITTLLEREKLIYLLQIFSPLAFLPWRRPLSILLFVPGFFFTLIATQYPALTMISFQYTAYWTPFVFVAAIAALEWLGHLETAKRIAPVSQRAWLMTLPVTLLITSAQHGGIIYRDNVKGAWDSHHFGTTDRERKRYDDLLTLMAKVPPKARIVSSERIVPHVSNRPYAFALRLGLFDAEYLLVEYALYGTERSLVFEALSHETYGVVAQQGDFLLAKRGHPTEMNQKALMRF